MTLTDRDPDVVTVGAGPAALAAAIICARAGLRVTIVASARRPSDALSPSETVHPGIESLLRELGAVDALTNASRGTYRGIRRDGIFTDLGQDADGPWIGHHIERARFDAALLSRATETGVSLRLESVNAVICAGEQVVGVQTTRGELRAKYVVDGSGRHAKLGRWMGFSEQIHSRPLIAWSALIEPADAADREPRFQTRHDGWTWIAPEAMGRATWTRLAVANELPVIRPEICEGSIVGKLVGKSVQWRLFRPLVTEGLVLVGDAAGIIDPGTGQGVFRALLSGIAAGRTITRAIAQPEHASLCLAQYDTWFVEQYELQMQRLGAQYPFVVIS